MDRHADPYRSAALAAGLDLAAELADPGHGGRHGAWTGDAWRALCLVAWGGGDVDALALDLAQRLRRPQPEARSTARKARALTEPPALPADAFDRLRDGDETPRRRTSRAGLTREERAAIAAGGAPPPPRRARAAPRPEPPPEPVIRPDGVVELLRRCVPPAEDSEARAWLESRGFPAGLTADRLPFRIMPRDLDGVPGWAAGWLRSGHRALFPLWNHRGEARSVVARPLGKGTALAPGGAHRRRLVLANPAAVRVLKGAEPAGPGAFVVEGEPDWLTFAAAFPGLPVLGVGAGAWGPAFSAAFRPGIRWWIGTDDNEAGDRYASEVAATLDRPAEVWRARVRRLAEARGVVLEGKCPDWNDALRAGLFLPDLSLADALNDASLPFAEDPAHG